jgi:hypothetical protein
LGILFATLAAMQTAAPIIAQKSTSAIVYHEWIRMSIMACVVAGIIVAIWQATRSRFSVIAMLLFYAGLVILVAFDVWIESAITATV